ncbi:MAG: acyl-CoA thioesterase [Bacteroidetes bacterium]|nr:MAG: acyl-CoA thioesterase [Bacteroidota bacterium]
MYVSETKIRVRYSETDKMGYVYYGNYPEYYEVARAEAMRELGMTYREMEDKGVMMPIASMQIKYLRPAFYDDLLTIRTIIKELPASRMHFYYQVYNEQQKLLNTGETVLAFVNMKTGRPCAAPEWFLKALAERWDTNTD